MFTAIRQACPQYLVAYILVDIIHTDNNYVVLLQIEADPVCFGWVCFPAREGPK